MNCPKCQTINPEGARFCFHCGSVLPQACSQCGTALQPGARFCHNCGQPVPAAKPANSAAPPVSVAPPGMPLAKALQEPGDSLERFIPKELLARLEAAQRSRLMVGERRVVTILFCDVKGSTLAASKLDPEEWAEIINGAFEHMIRPIYQYEGTVARLQGDGLLAFFGAPIAHEDDPQRAILAGSQILQAIQAYGEGVKKQWGIDFHIRVGINTGLVVVGAVGSDLRLEYSALGDAINMAARMEQTAQPGTVQIAGPTYKMVAPLFDFEVIEGLEVKGREAPVTAYRLKGRKAEPGSLRGIAGLNAPLIGRSLQIDSLRSALAELRQGQGQIISVMGEAGLGKSRLIAEFRQAAVADAGLGLQWMEGRSLSYEASTPYAPFSNLFRGYFELQANCSEQAQYSRIQERLENLFPGRGDEIAPFFATLLSIQLDADAAERVEYLEPPHLRGLIFARVAGLLEKILASRPLILYLDDLHWIDATSLDLLRALCPLADRAPLMIITAFRPRQGELSWSFHEMAERDYNRRYRKLVLEPLDEAQSRELVASLLQIEGLPENVRKLILDKTEGNPFYVEEIIRSLLDAGLVVQMNGTWKATKEIQAITLPDTLAGVITSRLDRLDETSRQIVQAASVIGREFSPGTLAGMIDAPEGIQASLIELQRRELVREKSQAPQPIYSFKHVLTQEAAYGSILLSNRRELHRRAAETLIANAAESAAEAPAEIARHLLEARQSGRAIPYLVQAGERAAASYATAEAVRFYRQAIELRSAANDSGLVRRAYEGLGRVYSFANSIPEAQSTYLDMLGLAESTGDIPLQISALNKLAGVVGLRLGQFEEAEGYLARAEGLSREHEEKSGIPEMSLIRCQMCTARADFESVVHHMTEVIQIGQETDNREHVMMGLEHVSSSLVYLTRFDEAFEKSQEAIRIAREVGNREEEAWLLSLPLPVYHLREGDFEAARAALSEGLKIADKIGSLLPQAIAAYLLAEMARWQGDYENALRYGHHSLEAATPLEPYMPFMMVPSLGSLGMVYLEISEKFTDKIGEFHVHALRLLESPAGTATGGTAWADLGLCALTLGDLKIAEEMIEKGLNHPNMFMRLERPRHLAGAALLACARGELDEACRLAEEARRYAEERGMQYHYPFTALIQGKVLAARGNIDLALQALERAEAKAMELGMRPIAWQARVLSAQALAAAGRHEQAQEKRMAAKAMVEEIAGLFEDPDLRQAYLDNTLRKVR